MAVDSCDDLDAASTAEQQPKPSRVRKLSLAIATRSTAEGSDMEGLPVGRHRVVALPGNGYEIAVVPDRA